VGAVSNGRGRFYQQRSVFEFIGRQWTTLDSK
jgi:hypothetical protein